MNYFLIHHTKSLFGTFVSDKRDLLCVSQTQILSGSCLSLADLPHAVGPAAHEARGAIVTIFGNLANLSIISISILSRPL